MSKKVKLKTENKKPAPVPVNRTGGMNGTREPNPIQRETVIVRDIEYDPTEGYGPEDFEDAQHHEEYRAAVHEMNQRTYREQKHLQ